MYSKTEPYRNPKLLALAKDAPCSNCGKTSTTVSAHANFSWAGKGMGRKADDSFHCHLCYECHHYLDQSKTMSKTDKEYFFLKAMAKTYDYLLKQGLLKC